MPTWTATDFENTRWTERNTRALFVAKHGDDRNDGHPQRPLASIGRANALSNLIVIASGVYNEGIPGNCTIMGDGYVILDGSGIAVLCQYQEPNVMLSKITVQNFGSFVTAAAYNYQFLRAASCIFRNIATIGTGYRSVLLMEFTLTLLDRAPYQGSNSLSLLSYNFTNVTALGVVVECREGWIQGQGGDHNIIRNTYLGPDCRLTRPQGTTLLLQNSVVEGQLEGMTLADYRLANPNAVVDCVSAPPGFNNPTALDYTLAATSQMRNLAFDGGFVGAYGIGINFSGLPDVDATTNMQYNNGQQGFLITDPAQPGYVEFVVKDFQRNWILKEALLAGVEDLIDRQTLDATLSYAVDGFGQPANVQSGALEARNTYWVNGYDTVTYNGQQYANGQFFPCTAAGGVTYVASGTGAVVRLAEAPNVRLYEMKYSTTSAVDCVSRPWNYFVFNRVPTVDAQGRSNGHPQHDATTANPITVRWTKLRLTLMPNSLA